MECSFSHISRRESIVKTRVVSLLSLNNLQLLLSTLLDFELRGSFFYLFLLEEILFDGHFINILPLLLLKF